MARLAPFSADDIGVGPYLCTPERKAGEAAFVARFLDFAVIEPVVRALHD